MKDRGAVPKWCQDHRQIEVGDNRLGIPEQDHMPWRQFQREEKQREPHPVRRRPMKVAKQ